MLEANLVRKHRPRYNIILRDDKHYPFLKLTTDEEFPRLLVARRVQNDGVDLLRAVLSGHRHAGDAAAHAPALSAAHVLDHHRRPLERPCIQYAIHRCNAPCTGWETREGYARTVRDVQRFLEGKDDDLAAAAHRGDGDGGGRGEVRAGGRAAGPDPVAQQGPRAAEDHLHRRGRPGRDRRRPPGLRRLCRAVLRAQGPAGRPGSVLLRQGRGLDRRRDPVGLRPPVLRQGGDPGARDPALRGDPRGGAGHRVAVRPGRAARPAPAPQRGARREFVAMAEANAAIALQNHLLSRGDRQQFVLEELQRALSLPGAPNRIEGYDISNIQGTEQVGSMVVWENGDMKKDDYKRFRIRTVAGADDFASLREVLTRRFARALEQGSVLPDLVLIDGGRGQLNVGLSVLQELGLDCLPVDRAGQAAGGGLRRREPAAARPGSHVARAAHAAEDPRRGPPLRDHVPQEAARPAHDPVGPRRASPAWARRSARACSRRWARRGACARRRWPSWPRCRRSRPSWPSGSTTTSMRRIGDGPPRRRRPTGARAEREPARPDSGYLGERRALQCNLAHKRGDDDEEGDGRDGSGA